MVDLHGRAALASLVVLLTACGAAKPPPDAPAPTHSPTAAAPSSPPPVAAASASAAASPPTEPAWSDPDEKPDGFVLTTLFDKKKPRASFPKKSAGDADCFTTVSPTGKHAQDYVALAAACGAPTGLLEYVAPVEGKLHNVHDPVDIYKISLLGGFCYRYFAVADAGIADLDLLIEKPGGALVGDDKTNSPIAIIDGDKPWCIAEDQTLEFHVKVDGPGSGGYSFGVWARPKR
jgi:hypothetical protein